MTTRQFSFTTDDAEVIEFLDLLEAGEIVQVIKEAMDARKELGTCERCGKSLATGLIQIYTVGWDPKLHFVHGSTCPK